MDNFNKLLKKYAEVTIHIGLNIQKGQKLVIQAPIEAAQYVRYVTKAAYEAGAYLVYVEYHDEEINLLKATHAPFKALEEVPQWKVDGMTQLAKDNCAFLNIYAPNPDLLKDVAPERVAASKKAMGSAMKEMSEMIGSGKISWSLVSIPTEAWAKAVFPGEPLASALEKLWEMIFFVTRVDQENPVMAWEQHIERLNLKASLLNNKRYKYLHYSGPGTNLTIELPKKQHWICAEFTNEKGIDFVPNLPTEEVFTVPLKNGVNGTVSSSKPLNLSGTLIENFSFTFKDGKVIEFNAEKGYDALKHLLETDEGASYLGEIAIVPHDSPISNSNLVFYNTLYDENASCHLALGNCIPIAYKGGNKMTKADLIADGLNDSITHVDFMIGSGELNIDGETEDGKIEAVFRNGNWVI
ncbi:aminopeptidase [Lottiidibacillus patelloidae]|uniref:Aminopeptidase n=1 Tax=Lottiidibacillus patelloidae TaxID=2670334 RepID=A0A263BSJ9_9BACI|nr:aminopeptidase [Lottiidibacillus patelloidae]OZM56701.1 aminopeptidase [Lottiidibacillus patelloidae]